MPPAISNRPRRRPLLRRGRRCRARLPSRPVFGTPRAAELGDTSKYREEIERQRARIKELEERCAAPTPRARELEDALKRGGAKDSEVQRLQRELDEAKGKIGLDRRARAPAPRANFWICASS